MGSWSNLHYKCIVRLCFVTAPGRRFYRYFMCSLLCSLVSWCIVVHLPDASDLHPAIVGADKDEGVASHAGWSLRLWTGSLWLFNMVHSPIDDMRKVLIYLLAGLFAFSISGILTSSTLHNPFCLYAAFASCFVYRLRYHRGRPPWGLQLLICVHDRALKCIWFVATGVAVWVLHPLWSGPQVFQLWRSGNIQSERGQHVCHHISVALDTSRCFQSQQYVSPFSLWLKDGSVGMLSPGPTPASWIHWWRCCVVQLFAPRSSWGVSFCNASGGVQPGSPGWMLSLLSADIKESWINFHMNIPWLTNDVMGILATPPKLPPQ